MLFFGRGETDERGLEFLLEVESFLFGEVVEEGLDCGVGEDEHFFGFLVLCADLRDSRGEDEIF